MADRPIAPRRLTVPESPLFGRPVLITRAREQAETLASALQARGAVPIALPTIRFAPPNDWSPVDRAANALHRYDWIIFTSANGVRFFFERAATILPQRPLSARFGAIGPATARAIEERGFSVAVVPSTYIAESVVEELRRFDLEGKRILLPRAAEAREVLAVGLREAGAVVDEVAVYQTRGDGDSEKARALFTSGAGQRPEVITLTSSSTARHLAELLGDEITALLRDVVIASIGPITSRTARELGFHVDVEADDHSVPGLVQAIEAHFARHPRGAEVTR